MQGPRDIDWGSGVCNTPEEATTARLCSETETWLENQYLLNAYYIHRTELQGSGCDLLQSPQACEEDIQVSQK